ncbi:MAG TPA: hypothetical protein VGE31_01205 [Candidatus Paceibacterota bacterium]
MNIHKLVFPVLSLAAVIAAMGLTGCASVPYEGPYQGLENRVAAAGQMANSGTVRAIETIRCPAGQVASRDDSQVRSDARIDYREDHGRGNNDRYITRYGYNSDFQLNGNADVRVQARANAQARRSIRCVNAIPLTSSLPRR